MRTTAAGRVSEAISEAARCVRCATPRFVTRGSIGVLVEQRWMRSVVPAPLRQVTPSTLGLERLSAQTIARGSVQAVISRGAGQSAWRAAPLPARSGSIGECAGRRRMASVVCAPTRNRHSRSTFLRGCLSMQTIAAGDVMSGSFRILTFPAHLVPTSLVTPATRPPEHLESTVAAGGATPGISPSTKPALPARSTPSEQLPGTSLAHRAPPGLAPPAQGVCPATSASRDSLPRAPGVARRAAPQHAHQDSTAGRARSLRRACASPAPTRFPPGLSTWDPGSRWILTRARGRVRRGTS